jgi:hypothetical protein
MSGHILDFQAPLPTCPALYELVTSLLPPPGYPPCLTKTHATLYMSTVKTFLIFSTFFITINVNTKRVINAESYYFTTLLNSSLKGRII